MVVGKGDRNTRTLGQRLNRKAGYLFSQRGTCQAGRRRQQVHPPHSHRELRSRSNAYAASDRPIPEPTTPPVTAPTATPAALIAPVAELPAATNLMIEAAVPPAMAEPMAVFSAIRLTGNFCFAVSLTAGRFMFTLVSSSSNRTARLPMKQAFDGLEHHLAKVCIRQLMIGTKSSFTPSP